MIAEELYYFDTYQEEGFYVMYDVQNGAYEHQENGHMYQELYDAHVEGCVLASSYQKYDLDDLSGLDFIQ